MGIEATSGEPWRTAGLYIHIPLFPYLLLTCTPCSIAALLSIVVLLQALNKRHIMALGSLPTRGLESSPLHSETDEPTLVPVAGALAGATAAAAYLDAKFHIRKDLSTLRRAKASQREFDAACPLAPPRPLSTGIGALLTHMAHQARSTVEEASGISSKRKHTSNPSRAKLSGHEQDATPGERHTRTHADTHNTSYRTA